MKFQSSAQFKKTHRCASDAGGITTKIKELIEATSFDLMFELTTKYKDKDFIFNSNPIRHLMKSCNDEAHRVFKKIRSRTE